MIKAGDNLTWTWPSNGEIGTGFALQDEAFGGVLVAYEGTAQQWPEPPFKFVRWIPASNLSIVS